MKIDWGDGTNQTYNNPSVSWLYPLYTRNYSFGGSSESNRNPAMNKGWVFSDF